MTRRERLSRLGDRLALCALRLKRATGRYPAHLRDRCQALHAAWCETFQRHRAQD